MCDIRGLQDYELESLDNYYLGSLLRANYETA